MFRDSGVVELWSNSGRGLILIGSASEIDEVRQNLNLPVDTVDTVIPVARRSVQLALWGSSLDAYVQEYHHRDRLIEIVGARGSRNVRLTS